MRKILICILLLLCCLNIPALAKEKKQNEAENILTPIAVITVEEMEQRLTETDTSEDLLYVKLKDDEVEIYQDMGKSRSLRKQLILSLPNTEMLRLYTTNKAVYEQMSKMLLDYENDNANFDGYKIITDVDQPRKLENGTQIYRFWFMKIQREKASRRGMHFPIGIGIGIGGGHHHHHGPWIGVGW